MRLIFALLLCIPGCCWGTSTVTLAFCLVGDCKYADGFQHFDYVNPDAPKGGILREVRSGSFDTLNPFAGKGVYPDYLFHSHSSLMVRTLDEPYSMYPLIAESLEYADDFSWVIFNLNPKARFSDGSSITARDILFSFQIYKKSDSLFIKNLYRDIAEPELLSPYRVRFTISKPSRKSISLLGYLRVLSSQYWQTHDVKGKHLHPFVTSGPYKVRSVKPGQSVTYERVKNYWAANLPANKGRYNFDQIRVDYLRDRHSTFEGFKAGHFDIYVEPEIRHWHQAYNFPAVRSGDIIRETTTFSYPSGMSGLVFNLRKDKFQNMNLRKALVTAMNFQWINDKLLYGDYQRCSSFFTGTALKATGLPSRQELELLAPFRDQLPEAVFSKPVSVPESTGYGTGRTDQKTIISLFNKAGYQLVDGLMVNTSTNEQLTLHLLTADPKQERLLLPFKKNLARVGIKLRLTTLDQSQFRERIRQFDFDLVDWHFFQSIYPGSELYNTWHSDMAMEKRSGNVAGLKNTVIDALLQKLTVSEQYNELIPIGRAMDRVLMHGHYVIPKWYTSNAHFAYWHHIRHPPQEGLFWLDLHNWWFQP